MALIIEDGTGSNEGANSYANVSEFRDYAAMRGVSLSTQTDAQCEALLIRAMDYIESLESKYIGDRISENQPLSWPRDEYGIPQKLKDAQCALAIEAMTADLMPTVLPSSKGTIIREKIDGAVEVQYADTTATASSKPKFAKAEALLSSLVKSSGAFFVRA